MGKFSVKAILRTDKILKNGNSPIYLQVIINSVKKTFTLNENVVPKDWDKKNEEAKGKGYKLLNDKISKEKFELERFLRENDLAGIPLSFTLVDNFLKGTNNNDFYAVFDEVLEMKKGEGLAEDTVYKYETLRKRLKNFKAKLFTSDIDSVFITKFNNYLKKLEIGEGGLYNHHKCLKCIINEAIEYKKFKGDNPYKSKKSLKVKSPDHKTVFLEEEEVLKILKFKTTSATMKATKYMFLLSCCTGLRYGDLYSLKISDIDWKNKIISKKMLKTKHIVDIPLNKQIRALLVRFMIQKKPSDKVFPEVSNQVGNRILKKIAEECKIDKEISFHVGRHTFASYLVNNKNVSLPLVSKLLGHRRIANTMIYTNSNVKNLRNVMDVSRYG
ncbi:Site-specific recombinase XerD [Chryseobacterium ureilyticum]|uniref:Site-specific recombinase XerD n=1 Tax=Chryseobacterium ureilyticum TaxID=373668 RepID=A0A1N7PS81_9FLAO|nr:site-specific integrase [Chryseobacterium ureilyticum]SIT13523.1 Site-specific recombinase XerD [Chryseobacterium ureilyticum]